MTTRTITIVTALALASTTAVAAAGFGTTAAAGPSNEGPRLTPVTEPSDFVPTTIPPTTVPLDDAAEFEGPVELGDIAPEPMPATTLAEVETKNGSTERFVPLDEAESPTPVEIDPALTPEPEHLAPCGNVPYNLEPVGKVHLADMTGDGSADDRLSIRREEDDGVLRHYLHLERSSGERSEALILPYQGQTPVISFVVQLDGPTSSGHPAPLADEVLVAWATLHSEDSVARIFDMFGTDERGCLTRYGFSSPPKGLLFAFNDNGSSGFECSEDRRLTRHTARPDGGMWDVRSQPLVRHDATTVFAQAGNGKVQSGSQPPFFAADC